MPFTVDRVARCIIAGTLPLYFLPRLPTLSAEFVLAGMAIVLAIVPWPPAKILALGLIVFVWATSSARTTLSQIEQFQHAPIEVEVEVDSLQPDSERIKVRLWRHQGRILFPPLYASVQVRPSDNVYCPGQRWLMQLVLRPVHAQLNEGGFDRQRFSLANHIPLTGREKRATIISAKCSLRANIMSYARRNYAALPWQSLISALAFGDRSEVSAQINQLLRETGTAHLMAISGMHIALAASLGWLLIRGVQYTFSAARIGYRTPLSVSLLVALIYCWLAGANPPALRAILALLAWSLLRLYGFHCRPWQIWRICLALILFFDPLSILSDSLWLSALAVAGLLIWYHNFPLPVRYLRAKRWMLLRLLHLQAGMMLLMMPLQVWLFHGISLSALFANLWAVPMISLVTVPLILLALTLNIVPWIGALLWYGVDRSLALVFWSLSALPHAWFPLSQACSLATLLCWLLLMSVRFQWWRTSPVGLIGTGLLLCSWRGTGSLPEWRVDMLDVGHGLAVVVSRNGEATVYDTGNRWPGGDAARSQILPWLLWQGLHVSQVIISHGHLDHIGGLDSLQKAYPDAIVRSALRRPGHQPCRRGGHWRWQALNFDVLWPPAGLAGEGNNQSCVVRVSDGRWRVLLTGDIEAEAELTLVATARGALAADLLQVPHHGSKTSSTPPFIRAVSPKIAIASAARYSAWRLPAVKIIQRYEKNHVTWRDTALSGQLSARFFNGNWQLIGLREQIMNRWYHQWFGVPRDSG